MKIHKVVVGAASLLAVVLVAVIWMRTREVSIAPGLTVERQIGNGNFVLSDELTGHVIVDDVKGWVITPRYGMGSAETRGYYAYDRSCKTVQSFVSIKEFQIWLHGVGESYEYSNEEGPADILIDKKKPRFKNVPISSVCQRD